MVTSTQSIVFWVAVSGDEIPLKLFKGELIIGEEGAKVVLANTKASNGVAHVIDRVIKRAIII
jgi:uncharacterized surface protein with fasciclin (FAS1) repeats